MECDVNTRIAITDLFSGPDKWTCNGGFRNSFISLCDAGLWQINKRWGSYECDVGGCWLHCGRWCVWHVRKLISSRWVSHNGYRHLHLMSFASHAWYSLPNTCKNQIPPPHVNTHLSLSSFTTSYSIICPIEEPCFLTHLENERSILNRSVKVSHYLKEIIIFVVDKARWGYYFNLFVKTFNKVIY